MKGVFKVAFSFLFVVCSFGMDVQGIEFEYCRGDSSEYEVKVEHVTISPEPIDATEPWTINVTASSGSSGHKFNCADKQLIVMVGFNFEEQKFNLCRKITEVNGSTFVISHTQRPKGVDPAYVFIVITSADDDFDVTTCIRVDFFHKIKENGQIFLPTDS